MMQEIMKANPVKKFILLNPKSERKQFTQAANAGRETVDSFHVCFHGEE